MGSEQAVKELRDMLVDKMERLGDKHILMTLKSADGKPLNQALPGQFVQVAAPAESGVLLRRPISINDFDAAAGTMRLMIADAGRATHILTHSKEGDTINVLTPLGNGFPLPDTNTQISKCLTSTSLESGVRRIVLIGGGVGVAPLYYYGKWLRQNTEIEPIFVLGARTEADLFLREEFKKLGHVYVTTDDGSAGTHGYAVDCPELHNTISEPQIWCVCGPGPMMKSIARLARQRNIACYVSLENMMACGLGACLCCVEKTVRGNVCVCTEGPVFNIDELTWQ